MPSSPLACEHARSSRILQQYRMTLRIVSRLLLLGLLLVLVAACGADALRQCEETVSDLQVQNQQLQDSLAESQAENQELQKQLVQLQVKNQELQETVAQSQAESEELQKTLSDAQAESELLRKESGQAELDLSWVRERLWILFHDQSPAIWACDDTASQVVPVKEMPFASPADLVAEINDRFQEFNPEYESPGLALEGMDGDTAVVSLAQANVVTEQMGSTGAQCYLAGVTFSLTSFEAVDHVRFKFKEGSHGAPGRYDRADFSSFLPLELDQP